MTGDENCPDVDFEGKPIPKCRIDVGVGYTINICETLKGVDCSDLLKKYEDGSMSGAQVLDAVEERAYDDDTRFNVRAIRSMIKEEKIKEPKEVSDGGDKEKRVHTEAKTDGRDKN